MRIDEPMLLHLSAPSLFVHASTPHSRPTILPAVFVQLKLFDLSSISDADNTATLDLGVFLRWHDTSLVGTQTTFGRTASEYEALWSPLLEVNNGEGMEEVWDADTSWNLKSYETGEVKYAQRYRGAVKLSSRRDLRAFPFDSESVKVYLGPKFLKSSKVREGGARGGAKRQSAANNTALMS